MCVILTQSCLLLIWIHMLNSVSSIEDCKLADFKSSSDYDSNYDIIGLKESYPAGTRVEVGCMVGTWGFIYLSCTQDGWSIQGPKCQPITCGHPGDADFAEFHFVKGNEFVFGAEIEYTCDRGYRMVSRSYRRRCNENGWDGVVPICEPIVCPMIEVEDNVLVLGLSDEEEASYDTVVRFRCKSRDLILQGPDQISCDDNGEWSGKAPRCTEVMCEKPQIENGTVHGELSEYKKDATLSFTCDRKFRRTQHLPPRCTKVGLRGGWVPTPSCDPVTCLLSTPDQGTRYEPATTVFTPDDTVTVKCDRGFFIGSHSHDTRVITCKLDGTWDFVPACHEIKCGDPRSQDYNVNSVAGQKRKLDDQVTYKCREGYKATNGSGTATCTRDGWTPKPLCEEVMCTRPNITNSTIIEPKTEYRAREQVSYRCDSRQAIRKATCKTDGSWSGIRDCTEVDPGSCAPPQVPVGGEISPLKFQYEDGDRVEYKCALQSDRPEGGAYRTCSDGQWNPPGEKRCVPFSSGSCEPPQVPVGGEISPLKSQYDNGDTVEYNCGQSYFLEGGVYSTCSDGQWNPPGEKRCVPSDSGSCAPPQIPEGGQIIPSKSQYDDGGRVEYKCAQSYFPEGGVYRTCESGQWNPPGEKTCVQLEAGSCAPPQTLQGGEISPWKSQYDNGERVEYTCPRSFYPDGGRYKTCENGQWTPREEKTCKPLDSGSCAQPQIPVDGVTSALKPKYGHGERVEYDCPRYYVIDPPSATTRTCKDGQWVGAALIRCLKPCTVTAEDLTRHNIKFKDGRRYPVSRTQWFPEHNTVVEFKCINGHHNIALSQRCNDGTIRLPSCRSHH